MSSINEALRCASRKTLKKMASTINEKNAVGPNDWSRRMLAGMGWKAGKGLGKQEDGIQSHVKVDKKVEEDGLGYKAEQMADNTKNFDLTHFANIYSSNNKFKVIIPGASSDDDDDSSSSDSDSDEAKTDKDKSSGGVSFDDLFKACDGRRPGRRGFVATKKKWERAEVGCHTKSHLEAIAVVEKKEHKRKRETISASSSSSSSEGTVEEKENQKEVSKRKKRRKTPNTDFEKKAEKETKSKSK
eukprot:g6449.t1